MNDETKPPKSNGEPAENPKLKIENPKAPVVPMIYPASDVESDKMVEAQMRRISRRSFLRAGVAVAGTYVGWRWLVSRPDASGIAWPFRRALEINENLARDYFGSQRLVPTFARAMAKEPRPNGFEGMPDVNPDMENADAFDPSAWRLHVVGLAAPSDDSGSSDNSGSDGSNSGDASSNSGGGNDSVGISNPAEIQTVRADQKNGDKKGKGTQGDAQTKTKGPSASSTKHKQMPETATDTQSGDSGDNSTSDGSDSGSTTAGTENATSQPKMLTLDDIKKLPKFTQTVEFKCIEGWSEIVNWSGARFIDFAEKYAPATKSGDPADVHKKPHDLMDYVSIETPDGGYYVGLDIASALHPQTLLCYEMNGEPLSMEHGGPLRLVIPVKYGVKNIKRIGTIRFTSERPKDYWAEQGYDWYAGH